MNLVVCFNHFQITCRLVLIEDNWFDSKFNAHYFEMHINPTLGSACFDIIFFVEIQINSVSNASIWN